MFQSFVITLREGVEAALIIGIVLGYLQKSGRRHWSGLVYWALAAAVVASAVAAYWVHRWEVSEDAYEGWLMLVGAVFVASMVVWMWRTGKRMKQEIEERLSGLAASPPRSAALGLFLFVFLMVLREGIETVLFLAAVSLRSTAELVNFMGGLAGLALAVALGVAFFKGTLRVNLRQFFSVTTLVLMLVGVQLLVTGVHELSERGVLPTSRREMAVVGPWVNNDALFFVVLIALCLFLVTAQRIQASAVRQAAELSQLAAPDRRKRLAEQRRDRFWRLTLATLGTACIVAVSAQFIYSRTAQAVSPPQRLSLSSQGATIPVAELRDHRLHHFVVNVGGAEARFIAILDDSDSVRVALDACQICGTQGYYQDGKNVICRNCGAAIYVPTIGTAGGCNPIHVDYRVEGETVVIGPPALEAAAKLFR
jgi:high-affinity iron transporter